MAPRFLLLTFIFNRIGMDVRIRIFASKTVTTQAQPARRKGITLWPLVAAMYFMACGGPYGLEESVGSAGYMGAILLILITPFVWSIPTGMMIAELSSAIPADGGYYVWVRRAMGPFWGFQEAWISLASSVFDLAIYPTLFVAYLGALVPGADRGWHGIAIGAAVIILCLGWNLAGGKAVGDGSLGMLLIMLGPFAVLTVAALLRWGAAAHVASVPVTRSGLLGALLVCMWNDMGYDNASNVAGEVENPQRTFPLALAITIFLAVAGYVIPILALSRTGIPADQWTTGSWAKLGGMVLGRGLTFAIVLGGMVSSFAQFNALLMSYS